MTTPLPFRGGRPCSPDARRATALADSFSGLPDGVTRWRLAAAVRAAARPLGLSSAALRLLEHYIDLTYDQDWEAGAEPVIGRPLVEIAEHLGRSERQIRNIERDLVAKGLLAWRDSANHHRKARRDRRSGRLLYAYGPSLGPLGTRAEAIIALADDARREIAEMRRLRIAAGALRRRIRAALASQPELVAVFATALARIPQRQPAGVGAAALRQTRDQLASLLAEVDRSAAAAAPAGIERRNDQAPVSRKAETENTTSTDTTKKYAINGVLGSTSGNPWNQSPMTETPELTIALRALGPIMRTALSLEQGETWNDMANAALETGRNIGIQPSLWAESCARLGRTRATLAILLVERGMTRPSSASGGHPPVRNASAYLRGMLRRADDGALHLTPSLRRYARNAIAAGDELSARAPSGRTNHHQPTTPCAAISLSK